MSDEKPVQRKRHRKIRRHPCEWCGTRQVNPTQCYPACHPAKDRHGDGPAGSCPRGRACAAELADHERLLALIQA